MQVTIARKISMVTSQGQVAMVSIGDAHAGDAGGDVEIEADRRMAEPHFHIHRHQDAEMHRVDAEAHGDWKQNRRGDQHDR